MYQDHIQLLFVSVSQSVRGIIIHQFSSVRLRVVVPQHVMIKLLSTLESAHSQDTGFLASVLLMMLMTLCRPLRHIFLLAAEFSRGSHEFQKCRAPCSTRELLSAMPPNLQWRAELLSLRDSATAKTSYGVRPRGQKDAGLQPER